MFADLNVTGADLQNILSLSPAQVTEFTKRGIFIRSEKRTWSLINSVRNYALNMQEIVLGKRGHTLNLADEKAALAQTQKKEAELRMKARYGDYVDIAITADKWAQAGRRFRQAILAAPDKIALRIPGLHASEKAAIEEILLDTLRALSDEGIADVEKRAANRAKTSSAA